MTSTYCFRCRNCGARWENSAVKLGLHPLNDCTDPDIVRDYRAESFTGGAELRRENRAREGGEAYLREQARIENRERDREARRHRGE